LTIIPGHGHSNKGIKMNAFLIFIVRLILGLFFGLIIIRFFRPEWGVYHGAAVGVILVALAYGMAFFRKKK
jgi:uncharacterized transporter YbjL